MIDNNNWNDALEVGIGAGASANGGMSYYITPYYTTNNGTETDFWNVAADTGGVMLDEIRKVDWLPRSIRDKYKKAWKSLMNLIWTLLTENNILKR